MLFKTPYAAPDKSNRPTGTARWHTSYNLFMSNKFHAIGVTILHMVPSYEIIDLTMELPEEVRDAPIAEYARQTVLQQTMQEFAAHAEQIALKKAVASNKSRKRKSNGLDPSLFS